MSADRVSTEGPPFGLCRNSILVVEDEFLIRFMLSEELRDAGYHVVEACDATEALLFLETSTPNLVISDVRMPGPLDGIALLARIRETMPELPVIIISGHLHSAKALTEGATQFLPKPYVMGAVVEAVRTCLEQAL